MMTQLNQTMSDAFKTRSFENHKKLEKTLNDMPVGSTFEYYWTGDGGEGNREEDKFTVTKTDHGTSLAGTPISTFKVSFTDEDGKAQSHTIEGYDMIKDLESAVSLKDITMPNITYIPK